MEVRKAEEHGSTEKLPKSDERVGTTSGSLGHTSAGEGWVWGDGWKAKHDY